MDSKALGEAIVKLTVVVEEVRFSVAKILEQNDKKLDREVENIIKKMDELSLKVDALSAADMIMPVVHVSGGTRTVKVADGKSSGAGAGAGAGTGAGASAGAAPSAAPVAEVKKTKTITEFFKTQWIENFAELKERGLVTVEDEKSDANARGAKTAQILLRRLATEKWKTFTAAQTEIVRAMKKKYESQILQRESTSITEEAESKAESKSA